MVSSPPAVGNGKISQVFPVAPAAGLGHILVTMSVHASHPRDPLHGITLETIVTQMAERHGWDTLAEVIPVRCFMFDPSVKSSLTFLRKTPWARERIESWYIDELPHH